MSGNYENEYDKFLVSTLKQKLLGKLLSALVQEFTSNKIASGAWTDKNKAEMVAFYKQLIKIMRDKDISTYLPDDFSAYVSILKKFPWNAAKMKGVKNKSLQEIIAQERPLNYRPMGVLAKAFLFCKLYFFLRLLITTRPVKPLPIRRNVDGSGTALGTTSATARHVCNGLTSFHL